MARLSLTQLTEQEQREDELLRLHEGGYTVADLMEQTGRGRAWIYRCLQRARRRREQGWEDTPDRPYDSDRRDDLDRFDHVYMELSDAPAADRPWCATSGDGSNRATGTYHVGGRVRSLRGGLPIERDGEPESDRDDVTPSDRAEGVVYVQR